MIGQGLQPLELCQPIRIVGERLGQYLDRHVPVEGRVTGAVDLPHAAFADLAGDGMGAESGADFHWGEYLSDSDGLIEAAGTDQMELDHPSAYLNADTVVSDSVRASSPASSAHGRNPA